MRAIRNGTVLLLLGALAVIAAPREARAQGADSVEMKLAYRVLEVSKVAANIVASIEAGLPQQRASTPNLPPEFWDLLLVRARGGADSLTRLIAPIYVELYTEAELRELVKFYESPLGQRVTETQPAIFSKSMEIGQQWGMQLGLSVMQELIAAGKFKPE